MKSSKRELEHQLRHLKNKLNRIIDYSKIRPSSKDDIIKNHIMKNIDKIIYELDYYYGY